MGIPTKLAVTTALVTVFAPAAATWVAGGTAAQATVAGLTPIGHGLENLGSAAIDGIDYLAG